MLRCCAVLVLIVLAPLRDAPAREVMPNPSKECAICHIRWVRAFDKDDSQASPMEAVMERQAGSGDMCLSCHDGSVADSRFEIWSTRHHTTDAVPSAAVKIPTDRFPLDAQGRMTCATCHTAHAVPDSSDLRTVIFLRQPNVDSSLCLSCHPEHAQKNDFQHRLGYSEAPVPAAILEAGGKASADGHGIICQTCHEPHGARNAWMLVLPPSELCVACHTQKSPEASPPAGAPVHRIGQTYPGFVPPATLVDRKATFEPDGALTCLSCHRLHDASGAKPLLIRKNEDSSLCLECHEQEQAVLGSAHDLRVSSPETVNADGERASVSGPCGACHRIHGWARNVPDTGRPHSSGCMECHQAGGPGSVHRPYVEAHPVGVPIPEGVSVSLPLDMDTKTIGCLSCHDPHAPRADEQVTSGDLEPDIQRPRSFLRAEGSGLCTLCHAGMADVLGGAHDPAAFEPAVRRALALHPSVGSCRVCHTTHHARGPHLWARTPADSPAGPGSNLCLACHDEQLVPEPGGTHHPLANLSALEGLSAALHAKTLTQGHADDEVGCVTCHDPHIGVARAAQLRDASVALCTNCHADKQGVVGSVHDPGANDWGRELGLSAGQACVDCHPVHGLPEDSSLRVALGGSGGHQTLCETCHRLAGPGQAAETPHAGKLVATSANGFPTGPGESIGCSTCHDIHQAGQPPRLSRIRNEESGLCLTCHTQGRQLIDTAHDLRVSAPDVVNALGERPDESGPCGACHLVHPQSYGYGSWAHSGLSGRDFGAGYCTGCHQAGACAADRVPTHTDHPDVPLLNPTEPGDPDYMPTFDRQGRPVRDGSISCLTCHEPHAAAAIGRADHAPPGRMFLRPAAHQSLCVACHGVETLWRFLYYHNVSRNPHPDRDVGPLP